MNIEGIAIETRPIFTEHNIFKADIFNPDNILNSIISTPNRSPKIPVLINQPIKFIERSDIFIETPTTMNVAYCAFKTT